ncbi:uncharacterized protein LOC123702169 [Colias croceus]|uniref:uncharacterized protein LOC123702169 n=1 Tax=Colias crocea TaxID=72248 RepID=UPI001E27B295|nr:uncharacterized protein LOC123702169 [Colias croceus]
MSGVEQLLALLEDTALLLQKAQTNLKKCPKQRLTKGYVEARLQSIEEYWNTFKEAHNSLVRTVPKEKKSEISYFVNEDFFVFEDLYLCIKADLKDLLINANKSPAYGTSLEVANNANEQLKLPKILLPTFSGSYEDWPSYRDMFQSLVHNNSALGDVQKLYYLKSSLTGEAENILKHVQITQANYEQSWNLLNKRFGNKKMMVNSILKRLFNQKKMSSQNYKLIKNLLDTTTECLNSLKNINIITDSWDPLIIFLVVQKLDPESHKDWEEYVQNDTDKLPSWEQLQQFLQLKFRTLELLSPSTSKERSFHIATPAVQFKPCPKCQLEHALCHCKEFISLTPQQKNEFVRSNNICFNCLCSGHMVSKCRLRVSCKVCQRRHHSLLHQSMAMVKPSNIESHFNQVEDEIDEEQQEQHLEEQMAPAE